MTRPPMGLLRRRQDESAAPLRMCCSSSAVSPSEEEAVKNGDALGGAGGQTDKRDRGRLATTRPRCVSPMK